MEWINRLREAATGSRGRTLIGNIVSFCRSGRRREALRRSCSIPRNVNCIFGIIEQQKAKSGRVRVIVLKARSLGSYRIAARFYKQTTSNPGLRTIIIGHEKARIRRIFFSSLSHFTSTCPKYSVIFGLSLKRGGADLRQHRPCYSRFGRDRGKGSGVRLEHRNSARLRGRVLEGPSGSICRP